MVFRSDTAYSRFVAWSKIILPMAAIAIISSLFLFSETHDPNKAMRAFDGNLGAIAQRERITAPKFAGMTPSGLAIQVSAREASPRATGGPIFDAFDMRALIDFPDGETIDIDARRGTIDALANMAELTEGITLMTSFGFRATTYGLSFALDRLDIRSQGKITGRGPLGELTAGGMRLSEATPENPSGYLLVFKDGVKLVYTPK